jgi:hypothetical protein
MKRSSISWELYFVLHRSVYLYKRFHLQEDTSQLRRLHSDVPTSSLGLRHVIIVMYQVPLEQIGLKLSLVFPCQSAFHYCPARCEIARSGSTVSVPRPLGWGFGTCLIVE